MIRFHFLASDATAHVLQDFLKDEHSVSKKLLKSLALELQSLRIYKGVFARLSQEFDVLGLSDWMQHYHLGHIYLLFEGSIESFVYAEQWRTTHPVDGSALLETMGDKYASYKLVKNTNVRQPLTLAVRGQADFITGLEEIQTPKIVIKPRYFTYESRNVLLVNRERFESLKPDERLNFSDCLMQEYLKDTVWPPEEWRFHFVGRTLCRVIHLVDKNNWAKAFRLENVPLDQVPGAFREQAETVARALTPENTKDNFTLDFLLAGEGLIFLEANLGNLNSFYATSEEEAAFVEPIFEALLGA